MKHIKFIWSFTQFNRFITGVYQRVLTGFTHPVKTTSMTVTGTQEKSRQYVTYVSLAIIVFFAMFHTMLIATYNEDHVSESGTGSLQLTVILEEHSPKLINLVQPSII